MSSHTCRPGHDGILADDCERCAEHASEPFLLSLDGEKMRALWEKMRAVEYGHMGHYATGAEALACHQLYKLSIWLGRFPDLAEARR